MNLYNIKLVMHDAYWKINPKHSSLLISSLHLLVLCVCVCACYIYTHGGVLYCE